MTLLPVLQVLLLAWSPGANWGSEVTKAPPGPIPPPAPAVFRYSFGWSGIKAGQAKVVFDVSGKTFTAKAEGGSIGMARTLWKFDTIFETTSDRATLMPIRLTQTETTRAKRTLYEVNFGPKLVEGQKEETSDGKTEKKDRRFRFQGAHDLLSAYLYLRTFDWKPGDEATLALFPVFSPYLIHVEAIGREKVKVPAGEFNAIKVRLEARKIAKKKQLEPFTKLKSATIWISDDARRLVLKSEAEIYVGTIFAELTEFKER